MKAILSVLFEKSLEHNQIPYTREACKCTPNSTEDHLVVELPANTVVRQDGNMVKITFPFSNMQVSVPKRNVRN